jgi:hypothetical protein
MSHQPNAEQKQSVRRRRLPPLSRLQELLRYDANAGRLRWRVARRGPAVPGALAGTVGRGGYRMICVDNVQYRANRVTWKLVKGREPPTYLDHENRNKLDDRIENLRPLTASENSLNAGLSIRNTSGVIGVHPQWVGEHGPYWMAFITVRREKIYLGSFKDFGAAVAVRKAAELRYYGGDPHALASEVERAAQMELPL